jgi:hypothetical protein
MVVRAIETFVRTDTCPSLDGYITEEAMMWGGHDIDFPGCAGLIYEMQYADFQET